MFESGEFWNKLFFNYKLSRFVFSLALLVAVLSAGILKEGFGYTDYSIAVLSIYPTVSLFSLSYKRVNFFDFILDIVFISVLILSNLVNWQYFSILYLFPLFFSAALTGSRKAYALSLLAFLFYSWLIFLTCHEAFTIVLKLMLNFIAFTLIVNAGLRFNKRIQQQDEYIKKLEREKEINRAYKHLFRISADLAHEIRNPLSSIQAAAELLLEGKKDSNLLRMISEESRRLNRILKNFLSFSRPLDSKAEVFNLKEELERVASVFSSYGKEIKVNVEDVKVRLKKDAFISAVSNIVKNCAEWAKSKVQIKGFVSEGKVKVIVEDDGPGIDEKDLELIFDPFFTKKENGTGLGLSIAKRISIELGGHLTADRSPLGGARFIFEVPVEDSNESFSS